MIDEFEFVKRRFQAVEILKGVFRDKSKVLLQKKRENTIQIESESKLLK